ncbi:MAG: ATP-binding cassette domain-containing protein [Actinobacteria bacterium]|nr:ATP-binding cassette domain-containing protein [Actinomycetota bacterium]MCL6104438.1 ATP-binding cassette domain-containing protein [Actinomycetota bacterium]
MPKETEPLLAAHHIRKCFGGLVALDDVSITVGRGEAVGLIGPNGAGKTTLFNCIYGVTTFDEGSIFFEGKRIDDVAIHIRARYGMARTFQRMELFPDMTVADHFLVAIRARDPKGNLFKSLYKDLLNKNYVTNAEVDEIQELLDILELHPLACKPVESLTLGQGRLVELGRALASKPKLLMADEPSSGLDASETLQMARVINKVRLSKSTAVLLVEHDIEMVKEVVSTTYVLDSGKLLAKGPLDDVLADREVRRSFLGLEQ